MKLKFAVATLAVLAAVPASAGIIERAVHNTQTYMYAYEVCDFEFVDSQFLEAASVVDQFVDDQPDNVGLQFVAMQAIWQQADLYRKSGHDLYCDMATVVMTDGQGNPLFKEGLK